MKADTSTQLHAITSANSITKTNNKKPGSVTCAVTAVSVWVQHPSWITGTLHRGLVLLTHLAALQVATAIVHQLTSLVAGVQVKPRGTRTHNPFAWCHSALVTAAPSGYKTQIWEGKKNVKKWEREYMKNMWVNSLISNIGMKQKCFTSEYNVTKIKCFSFTATNYKSSIRSMFTSLLKIKVLYNEQAVTNQAVWNHLGFFLYFPSQLQKLKWEKNIIHCSFQNW